MKNNIKHIVKFVKEQRAYDFTGNYLSMLERRIQKRLHATDCENFDDYFVYLKTNNNEIDNLIDVLTINVSSFFRNTLPFEYFSEKIIYQIIVKKMQTNDSCLRVWSAGCSYGEEPYTIAIIINEFLKKEKSFIKPDIFATDIDKNAIEIASVGKYNFESIRNVKYALVDEYFTKEDDSFYISPAIKEMVHFSFFDLLDKKHFTPPESIFGDFDIVFCRNVLIYFNQSYQEIIFDKLYKSMNYDSYLVLGEAEIPVSSFKNKFKRISKIGKIYRKIG